MRELKETFGGLDQRDSGIGRARDSQRGKVYEAERTAFRGSWISGGTKLKPEHMEAYVRAITASRVWAEVCKNRAGKVKSYFRDPVPVSWHNKYRSFAYYNEIRFGMNGSRDMHCVLHEMAHIAVNRAGLSSEPGHGPEFCKRYLMLLDFYCWPQAKRLREEFSKRRVRRRKGAKRSWPPKVPVQALLRGRIVRHLKVSGGGFAIETLRDKFGGQKGDFDLALEELLKQGKIEPCDCYPMGPGHEFGKPSLGYRLAEIDSI